MIMRAGEGFIEDVFCTGRAVTVDVLKNQPSDLAKADGREIP
jgi:hypothetical protein